VRERFHRPARHHASVDKKLDVAKHIERLVK